MAPNIGFSTLLLVLTISLFLPVFNCYGYKKYQEIDLKKINKFLILALFCSAILSKLSLIYSFIISDYSVSNVYKNSHHLKPLLYKISGAWGNHEGSMLLLILVLCFYLLIFDFFSRSNFKTKLLVNSVQSFIIANFAAFTAFASNPFERIFPAPITGMELNPLLQDIGLAMHPPMLYLGYLGFSIVFSFIIAALLLEKLDEELLKNLQPFLFFTFAFLTLGIGLGAWWAYRELGWGGYWFWDPVENISLMPWLSACALIHCIKLSAKKELAKNWTCFLAILTFILCLLGIFLTRSGILSSVHAFAIDANRGYFVIALIALIGISSLVIFALKSGKISSKKLEKFSLKNSASLILINNYFLVAALFVVLLGTLYPLFSRAFFNEFLSIGASYYNQIFTILIIPFLVFLTFGNGFLNFSIRRKALTLLAAIGIAAFAYKAEFIQIIILFLAILSCLSIKKLKFSPTIMAHFGFSIAICAIVASSSFAITKELNLKEKEQLKIGDFKLSFDNIEHYAGKNFIARQGNFIIEKDGKNLGNLNPQLRYYPISDRTTNEAAIKHFVTGDLYLVIGTKDEQENYAIRAYFKPFIYLLWLGIALIFAAAALKTCKNLIRKHN